MAFREVAVTEIREVLRAWLAGGGLRKVAEQAGVDRKTARRYVQAAAEAGLTRDGGPGQLLPAEKTAYAMRDVASLAAAARTSLDRHATNIVAAYVAGAAR